MPFSLLTALFVEPLKLTINLTPLARFLPKKDDFAPHPGAPFEGYYTRIVTATGSTIILIFSSVFSAADRPHLVHFSLLPSGGNNRIVVEKPPRITDVGGFKHPDDGYTNSVGSQKATEPRELTKYAAASRDTD